MVAATEAIAATVAGTGDEAAESLAVAKKPDPKDPRVRNARMIKYLVGQMPIQISATMHGMWSLCFIPRYCQGYERTANY
jgi:hypothetical protein